MRGLDDVEKTVLAESAGESDEGKYHVASTIYNRAKLHGKSPSQIVNEPHQYSGRWRKDLEAFVKAQPSSAIEATRKAIARAKKSPAEGVTHYVTSDLYRSKQRPAWANAMKVKKTIGGHVFLGVK